MEVDESRYYTGLQEEGRPGRLSGPLPPFGEALLANQTWPMSCEDQMSSAGYQHPQKLESNSNSGSGMHHLSISGPGAQLCKTPNSQHLTLQKTEHIISLTHKYHPPGTVPNTPHFPIFPPALHTPTPLPRLLWHPTAHKVYKTLTLARLARDS